MENKKNILDKISEFNKFGSKLGLERMEKMLEILGNPEKDLKVIHVAGTNGKGSTCRFIYSALVENGYKVGLFTSPFLERFTERIEINREEISVEDLEEVGEVVIAAAKKLVEETGEQPTEFEIVTVISLLYFQKSKVDFVVLEVGLGGIGDSTNVIKNPVVTAITTVSYDHMDRLGETLGEIAREKAGIIKPGVPVMSNVIEHEAKREIAKKAYKEGSILHDLTKIKYSIVEMNDEQTIFTTNIFDTTFDDVPISLLGEHQINNAMTALACIEYMRKNGIIKVHRTKLYEGFSKATNKGRFQLIKGAVPIVMDGAHNLDAFRQLNDNIRYRFPEEKHLVVMGILEDKVTDLVLKEIAELGEEYLIVKMEYPGGYEPKILKEQLETDVNKKVNTIESSKEAVNYINKVKGKYDYILVTGSLYFIGEMLNNGVAENN